MNSFNLYCVNKSINPVEALKKNYFVNYLDNYDDFSEKFYDFFSINMNLVFEGQNQKQVYFRLLNDYYRNEFFIKKTFVRLKLLGSSYVCTEEFTVLNSIVDLLSINGSSVAYEIKTDFDTLNRLNKQLNEYSKCFEYVYVICSKNRLKQILECIPNHVGIYVYDNIKKISFSLFKEASYSPNISANDILDTFTKKDLLKYFKNDNKYEILTTYSSSNIINIFKKCLKRNLSANSKYIKHESTLYN